MSPAGAFLALLVLVAYVALPLFTHRRSRGGFWPD